jgi:hypothetical protein
LRWNRADAHPGSGDARGRGATPAYPFANEGRYSHSYAYHIADACRYAVGNSNPNSNGHAFPKVRCYAPFAYPDAPADGHHNGHTDAPADANVGSHAHAYTDLASGDL